MSTAMGTAEDDVALVNRAKLGDPDAFEQLVRSCERRLHGLIASRLRARRVSTVEADDVLQEALVRSYRNIGNFEWRGAESFLRWLGGIIENVVLEVSRKGARNPVFHLEHEIADPTVSPGRAMRREERLDRLHQALDDLIPEHREVIVLSRIEGLSFDEIADRMGRSPAAVKQLLWRALKKLKERFGDTESFSLPQRPLDRGRSDDGRR